MFGIITEKKLKKITENILKSIEDNKEHINTNSKEIMINKLSNSELKGMISMLKLREHSPNTPQTTSKYHKKAKKIADKVLIRAEIKKLIDKDLSTNDMYEVVVNEKGLCRKTCFYKHLKHIRDLTAQTPRLEKAN